MKSQPETEPEVLKLVEEYDDRPELGLARGVMIAVMLSAPFWAAVIWFIWWFI
jgi:hypothetical protein